METRLNISSKNSRKFEKMNYFSIFNCMSSEMLTIHFVKAIITLKKRIPTLRASRYDLLLCVAFGEGCTFSTLLKSF